MNYFVKTTICCEARVPMQCSTAKISVTDHTHIPYISHMYVVPYTYRWLQPESFYLTARVGVMQYRAL